MHQRLTELLVEVIGDYGAVYYGDPNEDFSLRDRPMAGPEHAAGLVAELVYRRACTIYGGTAEIQRNIIAKAMFGL
jgi:acyl-CoA dehydrogenase